MTLSTPIEELRGIGPIYQKRLKKLGIKQVKDLLFHFPHRYEDFSNIIPIAKIKINETCCLQGRIIEIKTTRIWKRKMSITEALVSDKSGTIKIVWFNQPYLSDALRQQDNVCLAGKVVSGKKGIYLSNPIYEKLGKASLTHTGRLVPVYPETERLSSKWLRFVIKSLLTEAADQFEDSLPTAVLKEYDFLPIKKAIWQIHFPDSLALAKKAKERFSFEELFILFLWILGERKKIAAQQGLAIPLNLKLVQSLVKSLPFKLTDSQKKSTWQILKDLEKPRPMNRLLEGDVGSGKTVVATIAAINAIKAGYQTVFMAPTEILAKQHFKTISELLNPNPYDKTKSYSYRTGVNVGFLTGKEDKFISKKLKGQTIEISRNKLLEKVGLGEIDILIGTHALIQDKVKFKNLSLVILDEQHRFGVNQRAKLTKQTAIPHFLSMTATPIPRTLSLTIYGDLDLSLIDELPKGRKKILTKIIQPSERNEAYDFIKKEVKKGRQVFVVCPRIEVSEKKEDASSWSEAKAVKEEYEKLSKQVFPDLKVGLLHGKLTSLEKDRVMKDFKNKKINILVSTSVIEVGIDVPNATIMMIEGAERFGLAQLHQFRGRVGRARYQSYCFLLTDSSSQKTRQRLKALIECEDGFKLAEKDLEIRGPGDFIGTKQWGIPDLAMNSLGNAFLVQKVKKAATEILTKDPQLKNFPLLREKLKNFQEKIHLE